MMKCFYGAFEQASPSHGLPKADFEALAQGAALSVLDVQLSSSFQWETRYA